ncbi:MAG TPA: HAD family hydrolase [Myxococcota bacterium]|nr:HAD family hydrolase [Myxococcota bacterium]
MSRFVFLDRDGTLVRDTGYPHKLEHYELLPGVGSALRRLRAAGYRLAIVTNQSGIGRGIFDEDAFERFQAALLADLARADVAIERTYHCPHAPSAGCGCRKPEPGLLWRARDELGANLAASWVIGDAVSDVALAARAGCRGAVRLAGTGDATPPAERPSTYAEAVGLPEAADHILSRGSDPSF